MSFGENLQFYRKKENITQEQLAERLGVSRQTISKWEADSSYPEMEKIIQLCDMFGCTMDVLLRGEASEAFREDTAGYDRHMNDFSKEISVGVCVIIAGAALSTAADAFPGMAPLSGVIMIAAAVAGIMIFIMSGMKHSRFVKKHPYIQSFYREEESEAFENRFMRMIIGGIGLILLGVVVMAAAEVFPVPVGYTDEVYDWILLAFAAVGVPVLVYAGMQKSKYNIKQYNEEHREKSDEEVLEEIDEIRNRRGSKEERKDRLISTWCASIMIVATIIYVVSGLLCNLWDTAWIVYVVGALLCGLASVIISGMDGSSGEM